MSSNDNDSLPNNAVHSNDVTNDGVLSNNITNDSLDDLFKLDTVLQETAGTPAIVDFDLPSSSRDNDQSKPSFAYGANGCEQELNARTASEHSNSGLPNGDARPQTMLIFVVGKHRFSDSVELGILNEHPEALQSITPTQPLATSAFLTPALQAATAELRPSLMVQMGVQLTAIPFRLMEHSVGTLNRQRRVECIDDGQPSSQQLEGQV